MVLTLSAMLPLGSRAPSLALPDTVSGKTVTSDAYVGKKAFLVIFLCRHCPYVKHVRKEIAHVGNEYQKRDVGVVAISSNDAESYPDDAPDSLREFAREEKFEFPLCYDETQDVAKAYTAACTPDFFLFDGNGKLVYRGQLDDSRPGNGKPVTGSDLRRALDAVLKGDAVSADQKPSSGCNIKWKPGNEPDYPSTSPD